MVSTSVVDTVERWREAPGISWAEMGSPEVADRWCEFLEIGSFVDDPAEDPARAELLATLRRGTMAIVAAVMVFLGLMGWLLARIYRSLEHARRELADREQLAAMGRMTAGIAHEIRNPLGIIRGAGQHLGRLLKDHGITDESDIDDLEWENNPWFAAYDEEGNEETVITEYEYHPYRYRRTSYCCSGQTDLRSGDQGCRTRPADGRSFYLLTCRSLVIFTDRPVSKCLP